MSPRARKAPRLTAAQRRVLRALALLGEGTRREVEVLTGAAVRPRTLETLRRRGLLEQEWHGTEFVYSRKGARP
jgi:chromosome segregation and condensation protein ScpB